jgi:hypothetical protein
MLAIHGSLNLTYSSFYNNEEKCEYCMDSLEIMRITKDITECKENESNR